jgi:hypothetical protein
VYELTIRVYAPNDADEETRETLKQCAIAALGTTASSWVESSCR